MYADRIKLYKKLEKEFTSKLIVYVTGDRPKMETQIGSDVIDFFIDHLDKIGDTKRISLYLYTRGGNTAAAWNIINLLRMFCDELQVIIPHKAHSAGTIISLGANEIVMTKQATLSPIDPSINTPLNPQYPNNIGTFPVSVEAVKGYMEYAKDELYINDPLALSNIYIKLTECVHPLVLGQAYRSRAQIQMLASKLLINQVKEEDKIKNITDFLCSESGGHDYTINRREAETDLGLNIKKPTNNQYKVIKAIYDDISQELQLMRSFEISEINGVYAARRCLLESIIGGSDFYVTEGQVLRINTQDELSNRKVAIQNSVLFEGWRHDCNSDSSLSLKSKIARGEINSEYERTDEFQP